MSQSSRHLPDVDPAVEIDEDEIEVAWDEVEMPAGEELAEVETDEDNKEEPKKKMSDFIGNNYESIMQSKAQSSPILKTVFQCCCNYRFIRE